MTKEDIIRMALEAGLAFDSEEYPEIWQTYMNVGREEIERFAQLVAEAEREACAKVCEEYETSNDIADTWLNIVSEVIRARGNP